MALVEASDAVAEDDDQRFVDAGCLTGRHEVVPELDLEDHIGAGDHAEEGRLVHAAEQARLWGRAEGGDGPDEAVRVDLGLSPCQVFGPVRQILGRGGDVLRRAAGELRDGVDHIGGDCRARLVDERRSGGVDRTRGASHVLELRDDIGIPRRIGGDSDDSRADGVERLRGLIDGVGAWYRGVVGVVVPRSVVHRCVGNQHDDGQRARTEAGVSASQLRIVRAFGAPLGREPECGKPFACRGLVETFDVALRPIVPAADGPQVLHGLLDLRELELGISYFAMKEERNVVDWQARHGATEVRARASVRGDGEIFEAPHSDPSVLDLRPNARDDDRREAGCHIVDRVAHGARRIDQEEHVGDFDIGAEVELSLQRRIPVG